jgi:hypothetical protein
MMHCGHLIAHGYVGMGSHMAVLPPVPPPPVMAPHVATDTLLGVSINAKYSKTVMGPFGIPPVGANSDSGFMVPHVCIPPNNALTPVIIGFGGSKVMFSASTVQIDVDGGGKPFGACCFPFVPLSLNQACNDPCNYPGDVVIAPTNVMVGMTLGDIIGGIVNIAVDCAISFVANKIGGGIASALMNKIGGRIVTAALSNFTRDLASVFGRESAEHMTRDAVENIMERPMAQIVEGMVGKIVEGQLGGLADSGLGAAGAPSGESGGVGSAVGGAIDGPPGPSAGNQASSATSGLHSSSQGSSQVYSAD